MLYRYDLESAPQPAAAVPVTYQLRLVDSATGVEVPLGQSTVTVTRDLLARTSDLVPDPAMDADPVVAL